MSQQPNRDVQHAKRGEGSVRKLARPNSRREEHSAARVEEFLATALNLFAERNFASVTIKDIAEHLGVNTALIYYYFDSKTDLFQATIEHAVAGAFENVRALDNKSADPGNDHRGVAGEPRQQIRRDPSFRENCSGFQRRPRRQSRYLEHDRGFYVEERKLLSKIIREGIKQGLFKPVDPSSHGAVHLHLSRRLHGAIGHSDRLRS